MYGRQVAAWLEDWKVPLLFFGQSNLVNKKVITMTWLKRYFGTKNDNLSSYFTVSLLYTWFVFRNKKNILPVAGEIMVLNKSKRESGTTTLIVLTELCGLIFAKDWIALKIDTATSADLIPVLSKSIRLIKGLVHIDVWFGFHSQSGQTKNYETDIYSFLRAIKALKRKHVASTWWEKRLGMWKLDLKSVRMFAVSWTN